MNRLVRSGDSQRYRQNLVDRGPQIIEAVSVAAIARTVVLTGFVRTMVRQKFCFSYASYSTTLVLRAVTAYLARRFRVIPANRDRIVAGVVESMMDATPFSVIRRDVSSFYESIDADELRNRLLFNTSLPRAVRHYLRLYFDTFCPPGTRGLPRGVGLTTVLAELAMERFDHQVRSLPGVYRYFRYSDDIVIFVFANVEETQAALLSILPDGMQFNPKKHDLVDFTKKDAGQEKAFEYLGYRLSTKSGASGSKPRTVDVAISTAKIKRLKSRVILSLKAFRKDHDGNLLVDRLRLLSSNYQINRHGASSWTRGKRVRSGIYYNYRRCGRYEGAAFNEVPPASLNALDDFTHTLLKSPRSEFRSALRTYLGASNRAQLSSISFRLGFISRRLVRMSYARLTVVKGAWRNG